MAQIVVLITYIMYEVVLLLVQPMGAQWLSGRVLGSRTRGGGLEPRPCHCIVVLEQDTFILA